MADRCPKMCFYSFGLRFQPSVGCEDLPVHGKQIHNGRYVPFYVKLSIIQNLSECQRALEINIQTLHSTFLEFLKNSVLSRLSAVKNNPRSQWPITVKACYPLSPPDSRWLGEGSGCFVPCGHSAPRRYSGTRLLPSWGATIYHAASRVMPQGREGHVWPWCASPLQLSPWPESVMSQPQCSQWGNRPAMDPEEAELGVVRAPRCLWSTPVLKSPDTV